MILKLIDTSALLHSGAAVFKNFGVGYEKGKPYAFPTGGMYSVLTLLKRKGFMTTGPVKMEDIVFCFDRPSFRKKDNKGYKSNRKHNPGILFQSIEVEKGLKEMGFNTMAVDTLESDDLIYSLVKKYGDKYDKIEIYGTDRDLAALVTEDIDFISTNKNVPTITRENFETATIPGFYIPYNSIYLFKILFGDPSDNINPAIKFDISGKMYFNNIINAMGKANITGQLLNSEEFLNSFIKTIKDEELKKRLIENKSKVMPVYVDLEIKPTVFNKENAYRFLSTFKMKSIAKKFDVEYDKEYGYDYLENLIATYNAHIRRKELEQESYVKE